MKKLTLLLTLIAFGSLTAACNTTRGIGQDIEAAGEKIEDVAEDAKN